MPQSVAGPAGAAYTIPPVNPFSPQEKLMFRKNARLAVSMLALVLVATVSWCLADAPKTTGAHTATAGAAPVERLTLESYNKLMKAEKALAGTTRDPNLERALAIKGDPDTIRRWATQIESDKKASAAIRSAGMTPQEYTHTLVALLQAYGVSGLKKQNKDVPEKLAQQVPAENLAFVEKHASEIEAWGRRGGKDVKPNTMEDTYVEPADPAAEPAVAGAPAGAAAAEKPAATTTATPAKKTKTYKPRP